MANSTSLGDWLVNALRRSARPYPRVVHRVTIQSVMLSAVYDELNCRTEFRMQLHSLLLNWSPAASELFAAAWWLPSIAVRDLEMSYLQFEARGRRIPVLHGGYQRYPGHEDDASAVELRGLGYVPWPPRLRNPRMRRNSARRFVAYVFDGLSYERIVTAETGKRRYPAETKKVRKTIAYWSRRTGIVIPPRPPGRPRKQPQPSVCV